MDFTDDPYNAEMVGALLAPGEEIKVLVRDSIRVIAVTDKRIILVEDTGRYSSIPHHSLSAVAVSDGAGEEKFVTLDFGGGNLSRTVGAPNAQQAAAIATAAALG